MGPIAYRLRQEADRPRSLIGHATVPTDLLVEAANEIDRLRVLVELADNLYVPAATARPLHGGVVNVHYYVKYLNHSGLFA